MNWVLFFVLLLGPQAPIQAWASDWKAIPEAADEKAAGPEPVAIEVEKEEVEEPKIPAGAKLVSGVVRFARAMPETEIFIKDVKDSVFIPNNKKHNVIFEACEESRKNKTPVQLIVDTKSRQVLRLATEKEIEAAKPPPTSGLKAPAPSAPPGSK